MLEFCPLCNKNGHQRKIILRQVNLQEAVWVCEYAECPWPFGYQAYTFVSRNAAEIPSLALETRKPTISKSTESIQVSLTELGLDTPPVTPGSSSEVVHKDSAFTENTCSVPSLNLGGNKIITTKSNAGPLKNNSNKFRNLSPNEIRSIDTKSTGKVNSKIHTSLASLKHYNRHFKSQESLNYNNPTSQDEKSLTESKGGFSLSSDTNLESLDGSCTLAFQGFIDSCDAAEALTESIFNVGKPQKETQSVHESTVKCKKWLSDNSRNSIATDHCYVTEPTKLTVENDKVLSQTLDVRLENKSVQNNSKQLPQIKSIEKVNVDLTGAISPPNENTINEENNSLHAVVEQTSPLVFAGLTGTVKGKTKRKITSINSDHLNNVSENSAPQSHAMSKNNIVNKTIEIDGLFPINISYEVPNFVATPPQGTDYNSDIKEQNVKVESEQQAPVNSSDVSFEVKIGIPDGLESKTSSPELSTKNGIKGQSRKKIRKRPIPKLPKYEGFSFDILRKKPKQNDTRSDGNVKSSLPNMPSPDNVSTSSNLTWTSEISSTTTATTNSRSESVDSGIYINAKSIFGLENCSPAMSDLKNTSTFSLENDGALDSNFNLDQVIDELLLNKNENATECLEDDWLTSFFN